MLGRSQMLGKSVKTNLFYRVYHITPEINFFFSIWVIIHVIETFSRVEIKTITRPTQVQINIYILFSAWIMFTSQLIVFIQREKFYHFCVKSKDLGSKSEDWTEIK